MKILKTFGYFLIFLGSVLMLRLLSSIIYQSPKEVLAPLGLVALIAGVLIVRRPLIPGKNSMAEYKPARAATELELDEENEA